MTLEPSRAPAHLPIGFARCSPTRRCGQDCQCARRHVSDELTRVIDGSVLLGRSVTWCPLFIDARAVHLLEIAA